jgi:hypothetical protein
MMIMMPSSRSIQHSVRVFMSLSKPSCYQIHIAPQAYQSVQCFIASFTFKVPSANWAFELESFTSHCRKTSRMQKMAIFTPYYGELLIFSMVFTFQAYGTNFIININCGHSYDKFL